MLDHIVWVNFKDATDGLVVARCEILNGLVQQKVDAVLQLVPRLVQYAVGIARSPLLDVFESLLSLHFEGRMEVAVWRLETDQTILLVECPPQLIVLIQLCPVLLVDQLSDLTFVVILVFYQI